MLGIHVRVDRRPLTAACKSLDNSAPSRYSSCDTSNGGICYRWYDDMGQCLLFRPTSLVYSRVLLRC